MYYPGINIHSSKLNYSPLHAKSFIITRSVDNLNLTGKKTNLSHQTTFSLWHLPIYHAVI